MSDSDRIMLVLTSTQHGYVSRQQLLGAGVTARRIDGRVRSGILAPVIAGVYRIAGADPQWQMERATLLACRGGSLSFETAALLLELRSRPDRVCVTVPPHVHAPRRAGIVVHRQPLRPDEVDTIHGMTVTTPARTLLDLAPTFAPRRLEQALAVAVRRKASVVDELAQLTIRYPRHAGIDRIRLLLGRDTAPAFTRSPLEETLLAIIRSAGLPEPETNVMVCGREVDAFWRRVRFVLELDSWEHHGSRRAFVNDRKRDAALAAAGIQVLRMSWHQVEHERDRTLVQLTRTLIRLGAC